MRFLLYLFCLGGLVFAEEAAHLEEKISFVNEKIISLRALLKEKYNEVSRLEHGDKEKSLKLLEEIKKIKGEIASFEEEFRKEASKSEDSYAFWDAGEISLSSLVMEYGSTDFLYVVPYELNTLKVNLYSALPIPKESWGEMVELILTSNGIGWKQLNPYLRLLYLVKYDPSYVESIVTDLKDLKNIPEQARVFFILSPQVEQVKNLQGFFERFSDPKQTIIQPVGNRVVIVSSRENVERLINLYLAVFDKSQSKIVHMMKLNKLLAADAEKVLKNFFIDGKMRPSFYQPLVDDLSIIPMAENSLVLVGSVEQVEKAEKIIKEMEDQMEPPGEMTIFWYTCQHSNPEDLASVLEKVYTSFSSTAIEETKKDQIPIQKPSDGAQMVEPGKIKESAKIPKSFGNFIVDPKTGSILMVVRKSEVTKIQSILKKLDVPKKMVQIDVLLVEKRLQDREQTGINLLQIGTGHKAKGRGVSFDTDPNAKNKGMLHFLIGKHSGRLPHFDIAMNFLMAQENIRINANPSITAINQTPATISVVEEISINNGAVQVSASSGATLEKSYTRAQFGITIVMTPTIHLPEEDDLKGFITLQTNVNFDTTQATDSDKPPVTRRHIENEVRIADGETLILGGLRRSSGEDSREKIPFLGDIPGIGKLFGTTKLSNSSTEMFIFITPHIIYDPVEDLKRIRTESLSKRAGDIPEFLEKLESAKALEKRKAFEKSLSLFFGE